MKLHLNKVYNLWRLILAIEM